MKYSNFGCPQVLRLRLPNSLSCWSFASLMRMAGTQDHLIVMASNRSGNITFYGHCLTTEEGRLPYKLELRLVDFRSGKSKTITGLRLKINKKKRKIKG